MRKTLMLTIVILLAAGFAMTAAAETKVDVSGQVRVRGEYDDRVFSDGYIVNLYTLLRTRLGVGATVDENARFFVQFQDSRRFGGVDEFHSDDGALQSGTLHDSKNLDVH